MSLLSWYPFNGDTRDRGTLGNKPSVSGISYTNGKIGQCLSNGYISLSAEQTEKLFHKTTSISFWLYTKKGSGEGNNIIGNQAMGSGNNRKFSTWIYSYANESILHCSWQQDNTPNSETYISTWLSMPIEQWNHIVLIQDEENNKITFYVNGEAIFNDSPNPTLKDRNITYKNATTLCTASSYNFLNDFRVYDHALSQAEVKELSKALVVHYTFNDVLAEPTTNLLPTSMQSMTVNSAPGVYGNPATINITSGLTNGADYTLSLWQTVGSANQSTGVSTRLICYYTDGTYDDNSTAKMGITLPQDNKEYYYEITVITNKNKTISHLGGWILDHSSGNGKVRSYRNAQIEAKDHATPYTPNNRMGMLANEAGLLQPTEVQNLSLTKETNNGSYSGKFDNSPYTLITTPLDLTGHTDLTVACWVYVESGGSLGCRVVYHTINGSSLDLYAYGRSNNWLKTSVPLNTWTHIVITYSATKRTIYIDGVEKASDTISGTFTGTPLLDLGYDVSTNGRIFKGLISDYRVYTTCLLLDDIKDLYQTKAYISDKGDIMCSEFIEGKTQAQVTNKGTFEANEFYEEETNASIYDNQNVSGRNIIEI